MELWTPEHTMTLLPALTVMLIIALGLRLLLGNKSTKVRMIPIQIIACLLLLLEVGKQAVSFSRGYDLYHLPFHFCSLFLLVLPMMAFYRGKHQNAVNAISASVCTSLLLLMLIYPQRQMPRRLPPQTQRQTPKPRPFSTPRQIRPPPPPWIPHRRTPCP